MTFHDYQKKKKELEMLTYKVELTKIEKEVIHKLIADISLYEANHGIIYANFGNYENNRKNP